MYGGGGVVKEEREGRSSMFTLNQSRRSQDLLVPAPPHISKPPLGGNKVQYDQRQQRTD